jgi:chemotaxis response regulator CheB
MVDALARTSPLLVVSSDRAVRDLLLHLLREVGFSCSAVADGDEAFEVLARSRPLVMLLDMRSPGDDELLFLGLLRKRHPLQGAIILLPGRLLVVHDRSEHVLENRGDGPTWNLPSMEQLGQAVDWIATHTLLATLKPPPGMA